MESESNTTDIMNTHESPINQINLQLGDIIEIVSPTNGEYHETTNYIHYIDENQIHITNVTSLKEHQLNLTEDGMFTDESIQQIILLNRSDEKGYARQHQLMPKVWINVHFGGEVPAIFTGQISNLEEDMIEIITYPELKTIYVDFKYQGIPLDIPIDKIIIREKPASIKSSGSLALMKQSAEEGSEFVEPEDEIIIEETDTEMYISHIPEGKKEDENMKTVLHDLYTDANTITFGEELEEISQLVEVPEGEQRFSIDVQVNDMMEELLSTIPNSQRTNTVLDNIHTLIGRYVSLREHYSRFDENNNVYDKKTYTSLHKPLVDSLYSLNKNIRWIIPVVANRRKLNINNSALESNDIIAENMPETFGTMVNMNSKYHKKGANDSSITYDYIQKRTQESFRPFEQPSDKSDCLTSKTVLDNIDAVVDNLNEFYSTVHTDSGLKRKQYVIQRYNLGATKIQEQIMKSGKKIYVRGNLTDNDDMCVKSYLMLPTPVIKFSELHMPSSTLLTKSGLHGNYLLLHRLLRSNTDITSQVIEDFSVELDYEKIEGETKKSLFDGINEFIINSDALENIELMDEDEKFRKFLEIIVPKTRLLIRLYRKFIKNRLSFVGVVQKLEPFMVYPSDITYKQYMEIRYFIKEQMKELRMSMSDTSTKMGLLARTNYSVIAKPNILLRILSEKSDFAETFFKSYRFLAKDQLNTKLSSAELLLQMMMYDNTELYTSMIASILITLNSADNLLATIETASIDELDENQKIKQADCGQKFLSKKYKSISELQKDNNVDELFFEADYDDTPYDIVNKYEKEQNEMPSDTFFEFLVTNLIERHSIPSENAKDLAETLIAKKKKVLDGHYAILEIIPPLKNNITIEGLTDKEKEELEGEADIRKKTFYYRRLRNNWVRDDDISEETFIDTNSIFCNLTEKCKKNDTSKICESDDGTRIRIKKENKDALQKEFKHRVQYSIDELENKLTKQIGILLKQMRKNELLREIQLYKANNLAYELGKMAKKVDVLESPHVSLRDMIMGQEDFVKKQTDLCKFVDTFCREAMVDNLNEEHHWLYCKETNTKLLPNSIYRLAQTYVSGGDYQEMLDIVCSEVGTDGDDGEAIVDKHSGYILRKKDFSTEEGYDDTGRRVQTRDIIEKDLGVVEEEKMKKRNKIFENESTEMLYNALKSVCNNIDIDVESVEDIVLRFSNIVIEKNILSENNYKKRSEANFKKTGKGLPAYEKYKNETMLTILAAMLHIAIQTAVPSIKTTKTFPTCVRSFSGYPMTGVEDTTGINYISCVMVKMKSSIPPWDSLRTMKSDKLASRIKDVTEKYIMGLGDIQEMYVVKKEYILLHPNTMVPEEHKLQKWTHFLPPIIKTNVSKSLKNVTSDFKRDMLEKMKKGDTKQLQSLMILESKNVQHSYAIIEAINNIVHEKDQLLKTASLIPFVENACCNDRLSMTNPIIYFNEENGNIKVYLQRIVKNSKTLKDVSKLTNARMFNHDKPTGLKYPGLPTGYLEENVYHTFIHYCNFDRKLPIPNKLKAVCNSLPENYNTKWNINEKIEFLKKNGKHYTVNQMQQLMSILRLDNTVETFQRDHVTQIIGLTDLIESFELTNSELFEEPLRKLLREVLSTYDPKKMKDTPTPELESLTNYLIIANRNLYRNIMNFFDKQGNSLSSQDYTKLGEFLKNICNWEKNIQIHTIKQYIQSAIQNIGKVYPIIISNGADFYKTVCKHWNYTDSHELDIENFIKKYYKNIEKFKGDSVLKNLLNQIHVRLIDIVLFVHNLPCNSEIKKHLPNEKDELVEVSFHMVFDNLTTNELLKYCFYRMLSEYISFSEDPDVLRTEIHASRQQRNQENNDLADTTTYINSERRESSVEIQSIENGLEESEIIVDRPEELKSRLSNLLYTFLDVEIENKKSINYDYQDIIKRVNRAKEREKKSIIDYLGNMSKEERKVEELFKQYKLGRWNVGNHKGLVQYDKATYERERNEMLTQLYSDEEAGQYEVVSEMRREIFEIERDIEEEQNQTYDQEATNIENLDEDYMDGRYYEEDAEEDL